MDNIYTTGAQDSPYDIRTLSYKPDLAAIKGGARWFPSDIQDQFRVGICTAINTTANASKYYGEEMSPEFQYYMQKAVYDKNTIEGSSIFSAVRVAYNIGFLPRKHMEVYINADEARKLSYAEYMAKLDAIPTVAWDAMKAIAAQRKIRGYAAVPIDRDLIAQAINESKNGILFRFSLGNEWWTAPVEPLRAPKRVISGHAVNGTNFNGGSVRIANSWGTEWADVGTAYFLLKDYAPTEAWIIYYNELPKHVKEDLARRDSIAGKLMDLIQKLIAMTRK
jgi:hypothetical protein